MATIEDHAAQAGSALDGRTAIDPRVLAVMRRVPRHAFVPAEEAAYAYEDRPLPIGYGQTISQPFIVALMTDLLRTAPEHVVLEVGTGSGYQAAVLAELVRQVHTIEIIPPLADQAEQRLQAQGYANVTVHRGDGYYGLPQAAPFDGDHRDRGRRRRHPAAAARPAQAGRADGDPGRRRLRAPAPGPGREDAGREGAHPADPPGRVRPARARRVSPQLLAVGLVAGGALALEVLLTRILAIVHWHHFAGMVISLALLGYGASGSALTPLLDRLRPHAPLAFAGAATLFGLTAVASVAVAQVVPFNALELIWTPRQWLWLAVLYLLFAVPFFFAAACTGLALACFPAPVGRIYRFDLLGAGIGALAVVGLLGLVRPDRALPLVAATGPIAAALVLAGVHRRLAAAALLVAVLLVGLAAARLARAADLAVQAAAAGAAGRGHRDRGRAHQPDRAGAGRAERAGPVPQRLRPQPDEPAGAGTAARPVRRRGGAGPGHPLHRRLGAARLPRCDARGAALPAAARPTARASSCSAWAGAPTCSSPCATAPRASTSSSRTAAWPTCSAASSRASPVRSSPDPRCGCTSTRHAGSRPPPSASRPDRPAPVRRGGRSTLAESFATTVEAFTGYLQGLAPDGLLALPHPLRLPPRDSLKLVLTALQALEQLGVAAAGPAPGPGPVVGQRPAAGPPDTLSGKPELATVDAFAEALAFDLGWHPGMAREAADRFNLLGEPVLFDGVAALTGPDRSAFVASLRLRHPPGHRRPALLPRLLPLARAAGALGGGAARQCRPARLGLAVAAGHAGRGRAVRRWC